MRCRTEVGRAAEAIVASGGTFPPPVRRSAQGRHGVHTGLIPDDVMTRVVTSKLGTLRSKVGRNEPDVNLPLILSAALDLRWIP
jgi:hypothetical protein